MKNSSTNSVADVFRKNILNFIERAYTVYLPIIVLMLFVLFPFYWTFVNAITPETEIISERRIAPYMITFDNFVFALENIGFLVFFRNSFIVAIVVVFLVLTCSILGAYALTRFNFKGKKPFMLILLCTQFMSTAVLLIPIFMIFNTLKLTNTLISLILSYTTFLLPFNLLLMKGFMENIPIQLDEAALIDGCTRVQAIFYVIIPVILPGIVSIAAFAFVGSWNEFLLALMLLSKNNMFTIPIGLSYLLGQFDICYGSIAAASIIALFPPLLLFGFMQKYLIGGLSTGAVKG